MIGRVVILTGNQLCNNPRVIKEAGTLARAGYYKLIRFAG